MRGRIIFKKSLTTRDLMITGRRGGEGKGRVTRKGKTGYEIEEEYE
jgi:hypothetical protein